MDVNGSDNIDSADVTLTPETESEAVTVIEDERPALCDARAQRQA
jgi:hypothetical protein